MDKIINKGFNGEIYSKRPIDRGQIGKGRITLNKEFVIEYSTWHSMKKRCYSKRYSQYEDYGGRGIIVCDHWKNSFINFLQDMGKRPEGDYSIDRINNDGNYEPNNCRWATRSEQQKNKRAQKINRLPIDC